MRSEASQEDVVAILEALGYFAESDDPGGFTSSGAVTGPKGFWMPPLDPLETISGGELYRFLVEEIYLEPEDVEEAIDSVLG